MIIERRRDTFWDTPGNRWVMHIHDHLIQSEFFGTVALTATGIGVAMEAIATRNTERAGGAVLILMGLGSAYKVPHAIDELREDIQFARNEAAQQTVVAAQVEQIADN